VEEFEIEHEEQEFEEVRPKVDLTEGSVLRSVLHMGLPSMFGFGAMTIYGLTDMFWVWKLGAPQVAAITMFGSIAWVLGSTNQIVGTGSVALISRRFGEKKYEASRDVIRQTLLLKFALAIIMAAIGLLIVPRILGIMNAEPDVRGYAIAYADVYFYGLPFIFSSYTVYTALRGIGDAPKAMYIMLISVGLNVALDPICIFGLKMGVAGAALATAIAAFVAVVLGLYVLSSGRANIRVPLWGRFHPNINIMFQILKIGVPAVLNGVLRSVAHWLVLTLVATFGTIVVAAFGVAMRIMELGILFGVGLELGASALVGQNLGAGKKERAHEAVVKSTLLVLAICGALGVVEIVLARQILGLFTDDPAVLATGVPLLRLMAIAQVLIAMHIVLGSAFYGSGNTWPPTVIAGVIEWGLQIPLILFVIHVLETSEIGVWYTFLIVSVIEVILTYLWFRRGRWKDRVV